MTNKDPASKKKEYVQTRDVYKNGVDIRQRLNYSTGVINFKQRQILATSLDNKPVDAPKPGFISHASKMLYTPALTKIDGYTQHPRPVEKPYSNKIDHQSECITRHYMPK